MGHAELWSVWPPRVPLELDQAAGLPTHADAYRGVIAYKDTLSDESDYFWESRWGYGGVGTMTPRGRR